MSDDLDDLTRDPANVVREGAASDGAESEQAISQLPRLLRYAHLALHGAPKERILAEVVELVPEEMVAAAAWSEDPRDGGWMELAGRLDAAAVCLDQPILRTLSDAVRLTSMSIKDVKEYPGEALRVVAALQAALREADTGRGAVSVRWLAGTERMLIGWSVLIGGCRDRYVHRETVVHRHAYGIGKNATHFTRQWEEEQVAERDSDRRRREAEKSKEQIPKDEDEVVPDGHVVVCQPLDTKSNTKTKEACRGHEHAIGRPLPLAPMPDIAWARRTLAFEFPYAEAAIDTLLAPLIGRATVFFPPVVLVGAPGSGKSRLVRRLAECLGVGLWRTDGARADGASFGGTDRRWHSTEPCHAFLAVSRGRIANPMILVDELDKSATRQDYGRLWDSLLSFLEPETARSYPDPCLQTALDLSHVSLVATANSLTPLPAPLLDRLRVIAMPEPRAVDLDSLIAPLTLDLLAEQKLDARWMEPLAASEIALLATKWKGGSVRRLKAYLSVILRARERGRGLN